MTYVPFPLTILQGFLPHSVEVQVCTRFLKWSAQSFTVYPSFEQSELIFPLLNVKHTPCSPAQKHFMLLNPLLRTLTSALDY